jgi:uncharacterized membrane-anchored protein
MAKYTVKGISVEARRPTLAELTAVKEANATIRTAIISHESAKALCKSCLAKDDFIALSKAAPACFVGLASFILEEACVGGAITLFEEWELDPFPELVKAYVDQQTKSAGLYPDTDDPRRSLYPIALKVRDDDRRFILRMPHDREVDETRKVRTAEAAKAFCSKICVFGDMAALEAEAPGAYFTIQEFALDLAGDWSVERLGK